MANSTGKQSVQPSALLSDDELEGVGGGYEGIMLLVNVSCRQVECGYRARYYCFFEEASKYLGSEAVCPECGKNNMKVEISYSSARA